MTARPLMHCTVCRADREVGQACPALDCEKPLRDVRTEEFAATLADTLRSLIESDIGAHRCGDLLCSHRAVAIEHGMYVLKQIGRWP